MLKKSSKLIANRLDSLLSNIGDMALKRRARMIVQGLDLKDGDSVLDIGCGDGYYLYLLSNLGIDLKLVGIDNDKNALDSARGKFSDDRINLINADILQKLPLVNNSFNKIIMSEVAEHLSDDLKGFKQVYRVLKPGGIICITVPNADYPIFWDPVNWILEKLFSNHIRSGFWSGIWNQHIRLYKKEKLEMLIKKTGFKILDSCSYTWWSLPFNHYLVNLTARLIHREGSPKKIIMAINKFNKGGYKKPTIIKYIFKVISLNDKVNDLFKFKSIGVGIFIKASKLKDSGNER